MISRTIRCALLAAAVLAARPLGAQGLEGASAGEPVRVEMHGAPTRLSGVLLRVSDDSLYVRQDGATMAVPLSQVRSIEVRRPRSAGEGVGRGITIGVPIGLLAGYAVALGFEGGAWDCMQSCGGNRITVAAVGGAIGLGVGMLFGAEMPGSRWEPVSARPGVAAGPAPGGGVALRLNLKL
ncbi:MAG TPA: hypothetical protein VJT67_03820 [Longimicrobiaceae bacterium]|nr:hypothetical protein [Longimicrobiaceae bacterium]